jgi:hypothetical protein
LFLFFLGNSIFYFQRETAKLSKNQLGNTVGTIEEMPLLHPRTKPPLIAKAIALPVVLSSKNTHHYGLLNDVDRRPQYSQNYGYVFFHKNFSLSHFSNLSMGGSAANLMRVL